MRRFEIVNEEEVGAAPCGVLICDQSTTPPTFSVELSESALPSDVPLAFEPFVERGERTVPREWVDAWVAERIAPPGRQNIGEILRNHGIEEYDACELLASDAGRSSQDGFALHEVTDGYRHAGTLGKKLARLRLARDLTQGELAERSGVRLETICRIERGATNPTIGTLERLGEALGARVSIDFNIA